MKRGAIQFSNGGIRRENRRETRWEKEEEKLIYRWLYG
jgi:hypothetical protein